MSETQRCMNCGGECAAGFSTCSQDCNLGARQAPLEPKRVPAGVSGAGLIHAEEVARRLGKNVQTVYNWTKAGKIPCNRLGPRTIRYDFSAVEAALGVEHRAPAVIVADPQPVAEPTAKAVGSSLEVASWRCRALAAAKESFRDIMLEGADEAKARGDSATQAKFLEDFIFFEDGLQLVYNGRSAS